MGRFKFNEEYLSQIPALQTLIKLGYKYLPPSKTLQERKDKFGNVLLEGILESQLRKLNSIEFRGGKFPFTDENLREAIDKLKNLSRDGLINANQEVYDLLTLGISLQQNVEGTNRGFNLHYIDWLNPENNVYHVSAEFSVERTKSNETIRPDIVLFVNGIPFAVIECKSPKEEVDQAVTQQIRNQRREYAPYLFAYTQLLIGTNKNEVKYATVGTPPKFWAIWKEKRDKEEDVQGVLERFLSVEEKAQLFTEDFSPAKRHFEELEAAGGELLTEQDRVLYSLCRPERLMELAYKFTVFDGPFKKVARYHQYFVVKSTLERVKQESRDESRQGGVIWQTQGSGKSLSMVMLTRNLALDPDIPHPRIIVVTDRDDLDKQLKNTFSACGLDPQRATSGRNLLSLVRKKKEGIITTLIHKFEKVMNAQDFQDPSSDIFVLVDESHRTNFGSFAARMRQMFPNACYLGFTGTPLTKKEKNNFSRFGDLISPHYSIKQAVEDKVVVPLLYEGRHVEITQNQEAIDLWFERHTQGLSDQQRADLKRKYARAEMLNKSDQVIYTRAFDVSEHFRANWQGTGFKAQLVAPSKKAALKYYEYLNELGFVSSDVIISHPDSREGYDDVDDKPTDEVQQFWDKMMSRYGTEEEYNRSIIERFKSSEDPEILIVVDKLITGFDAPRNTVLYLCRMLREHTLLQAIARVNRLYEDEETHTFKEFGYIIDYASVLGAMDKALNMYSEAGLEGFDPRDLEGTLGKISDEIAKMPQRNSDLWDVFREVKNQKDEEAYEQLLADESIRDEFYEHLKEYGKALGIALSSEKFVTDTPSEKLQTYRQDLKRFENLKVAVKRRYAETICYSDYEPKIKKILDTHIQANEVVSLNEPVNIFDKDAFQEVKDGHGIKGKRTQAACADTITHATRKAINEKLEEDPAFYERFSKLIQQAIDAFRAKRISDLEYFKEACRIREAVVQKARDDVPKGLEGNDEALAFYGVVKESLELMDLLDVQLEEVSKGIALVFQTSFKKHWKVHFWEDTNAQNCIKNELDDYLFDEVQKLQGIQLGPDLMDEIIERLMKIARCRTRR